MLPGFRADHVKNGCDKSRHTAGQFRTHAHFLLGQFDHIPDAAEHPLQRFPVGSLRPVIEAHQRLGSADFRRDAGNHLRHFVFHNPAELFKRHAAIQ